LVFEVYAVAGTALVCNGSYRMLVVVDAVEKALAG